MGDYDINFIIPIPLSLGTYAHISGSAVCMVHIGTCIPERALGQGWCPLLKFEIGYCTQQINILTFVYSVHCTSLQCSSVVPCGGPLKVRCMCTDTSYDTIEQVSSRCSHLMSEMFVPFSGLMERA